MYYFECVRCIITFNTLINQHVIMCVSIGFNKGILSASKITKGNRKILFHRTRCLSIHSNGCLLFANDCFYKDTTYILIQRCLNLIRLTCWSVRNEKYSNCYQNVVILGHQIRQESITHDCRNYEDSRKENDFLEQ